MNHDTEVSSTPDYRATIRRRRVTLTAWGPWLATGGPAGNLLRQRGEDGVAIADLVTVHDNAGLAHELIVHMLGGDTPEARAALVNWAGAAGYGRVWLPDDLVEIEADPRVGGIARTRCGNCGVQFAEGHADFWVSVRRSGIFPVMCQLCGGDLPQWSVRRGGGDRRPNAVDAAPTPDHGRR